MGLFDSLFGSGGKGAKPKGDEDAESAAEARGSQAPPEPAVRKGQPKAQEAEREEDSEEEDPRVTAARAQARAMNDPRVLGVRVLLQQLEMVLTQIEQRLEPLGVLGQLQGMVQAVAITVSKSDKTRDQAFTSLRAHLTQEVDRLGASLRLDAAKQGALDVLKALLPAMDDVDLILREAPAGDEARHLTSLRMVQKKFRDAIARLGVEVLEVQERVTRFDPAVHEAEPYQGEAAAVEGLEAGTVVRLERAGYRVGETLVRPARVVVVKG